MFSSDDKILVYPVDRKNLPGIKSTVNYPNIRICRLVSPESWGYKGESVMCADGLVVISNDYSNELDYCSAVWIVGSWRELDFNRFIEPAIREASRKGKRIVCSRSLSHSEKELLSSIEVSYLDYSSFSPSIVINSRVREIRTPVAFVMSNTEFCNQFFIETAICAELRNRDYETVLISSQKVGSAFGYYTVPSFFFSGEYSENSKVIALNQYICHLEMKHQPEIIIIGVPGAAMPFDYQYTSDFGVLAYEISEAVKPDFVVLSTPCMPFDTGFFSGIEESLFGRLGVTIDIHSLSPYALDFSDSVVDKSLSYLSVDDEYVEETIKQFANEKLLNLNNKHGIETAVDRLIDKLSSSPSSMLM